MKDMNRVRTSAQKIFSLMNILTTVLKDYVPEVRHGLRKLVWGLKILEGRCISSNEAEKLNIHPGSRPLTEKEILQAAELIIEGLSLLEGFRVDIRVGLVL